MSISQCELCEELFDTDFELHTDDKGNCICDRCWEGVITCGGFIQEDE